MQYREEINEGESIEKLFLQGKVEGTTKLFSAVSKLGRAILFLKSDEYYFGELSFMIEQLSQ